MREMRKSAIIMAVVAGLWAAPYAAGNIVFPPPESAWVENSQRNDLRPWNIWPLANKPTIDGEISLNEWGGAAQFTVLDPATGALLGTLRAGLYDGFVYVATDWMVNDNPDPLLGGGNAWRVGTAMTGGPGGAGTGMWYEIYVQEVVGATDITMAREADSEAELQGATFVPGSDFGINAASGFNGQNWQYELFLGSGSGPDELPLCWYWEWRQIDPRPGDGVWVPVYDGSIHHVPEPFTALGAMMGLSAIGAYLRRRRAI